MQYLSLIFIFFLIACDLDKFTGSDFSSQEVIKTAKIHGNIFEYYSGKAVSSAFIRVGRQETMSNINGNYLINYLISESEQRNKPVKVEVFKTDYYPNEMEIILSPLENNFNFSLKYAAPIIKKSVRVPCDSDRGIKYVFQAIIMDYQGAGTIERVWARQLFTNFQGESDSVFIDLYRVRTVNANTSYYQNEVSGIGDLDAIEMFYTVWVEDNEGYCDDETRGCSPTEPDTLIF